MKIEELYSKLAEHKPEGVVKEGKEWSKGVLKALCDWKGTSFSDLCKAIGYDELDDSIKSYLETYFKRAKDGTLKAGGKGDFANQWIEWNKMIKDNKSIKEASNGKPQDELKEDGWRNIESIVGSLAVGLGEQIENVIREKREEAEEEAAALEDAKKDLDDMKESRKKEIKKEKERVAGIAAREKELQFGDGDVNFEDLNKNLNEYYERFKKFVSVQDTFLNDKKDGVTTCDRLIYNYRKKVLPGLDERLKRIIKTKEDVVGGLKASGYTEKFENFEKVKGFKDFESNNIQALKLGAVVQILLEDGVAGNRGEEVKNAANATIESIGKSLRVSGIDKTDERDFSKFILKANAQGKDLHGENIKSQVNNAIIELINRLSTSVERAVEVDNDWYDTRFLVDIFLKKVSKALDGYGLREDTKDYQEAEDSNLKIKLVDEWITLREYSYKEKSSTATWIRNLSNEVDSMLESKINPEDKIKRFKKKLLDILKISSPKASVNDANVKKDIKEYVKELAEELDEFLEKIKNVNKLSIEFATKRGTYTEGEGEEKKEVEIDKKDIVICLTNMIYKWDRALGKNGNPAALQAGTIYDTLRSIVIDGGINSGVIIENYRWKKGSKTAEWLNKIEDDIVKKSKKLDPMEYLTNFRKNVNAFPSFTFK